MLNIFKFIIYTSAVITCSVFVYTSFTFQILGWTHNELIGWGFVWILFTLIHLKVLSETITNMLDVGECGDCIEIAPCKGCTYVPGYTKYVHAPNWLERLFGITFKIKIDDAYRDVARLCATWNAKEDRAAIQLEMRSDEIYESV